MSSDDVRGFLLLLRWNFLRQRGFIVLLMVIQVALGVGVIYGFSFLVPSITPTVALFFATGAPTLTLILIGLTAVPQETAMSRVNGRYGYLSALPVPRLAMMFADVTFWVLVQLPGSAVALWLAARHFHLHLEVSPLLVLAAGLVSLTAATVGYAIAVLLPPPATQQVSQFLSLGLILFSPINFPLDRLPDALQAVHRVLPVTYMADIVRGTLTGSYDAPRTLAFAMVGAWCALGLGASAWAANRRG